MTTRESTAPRRVVSASALLNALAGSLDKIRVEDGLTYDDLGRVLGKGRDAATRYCDGSATMDALTYLFAKQAFNGRFTREADALIGYAQADTTTDFGKLSAMNRAAQMLIDALADGDVSVAEIAEGRKLLEEARDGIDALLARLTPKAVKA